VLCIAVDRDQAAVVFRMIRAFFEEVPTLRGMVKAITADSIELRNKVVIEVRTNSYRSVRGRSLLACIFDEVAFWRSDDSSNPDSELYAAVRPGLARVPASLLCMITSAHRRGGIAYERWKKFHGVASANVLVVKGSTLQFNPTADRDLIEADIAEDPQRYRAEYLSEWRDDLSTFITRDLLEAAVDRGVTVRSPQSGIRYESFCDFSGGAVDSSAAAVSHQEKQVVVLDALIEIKSPHNPDVAAGTIAKLLKSYGIRKTTGDAYAKGWPVAAMARNGVTLEKSERNRSEIYIDWLPQFTAGRARLLDNDRLVAQGAGLERRVYPTGLERVDHGRGGHDDLVNVAAGAMVLAASNTKGDWMKKITPAVLERAGMRQSLSNPYQRSRLTPLDRPALMGAGGRYARRQKVFF
jgi:hypothetical protein